MSDSVGPHRWQPTRLLRPWDSPGKNTGVGCHFFLQCMKVKRQSEVDQSCPTLCDQPAKKSLTKTWAKGLYKHFSLEDIGMVSKYLKRISALLISQEMQIKTAMRKHLLLVEWLSSKRQKTRSTRMWRRGQLRAPPLRMSICVVTGENRIHTYVHMCVCVCVCVCVLLSLFVL